MEPTTFRVNGMTCGGCAKHVEKALKQVPGVAAVVIDVAKGTATVEGALNLEAMAASVTAAGYEWLGPA